MANLPITSQTPPQHIIAFDRPGHSDEDGPAQKLRVTTLGNGSSARKRPKGGAPRGALAGKALPVADRVRGRR